MIHVAIIEDDQAIAQMYSMKCELSGISVALAGNGKEGLLLLETFTPDVILLDLMMPEMNGAEFMHMFRQNSTNAQIPVIVLTNTGAEEAPQSLWGTGIADFIIKANCTPAEVIQKIKTVYENSQKSTD